MMLPEMTNESATFETMQPFFNIKMHSIKSRFVIGQQNTLFTGLRAQSLAQEFYKLEL